MHRIRRHLTYANLMSTIAVIFAVVGGSTAVAVTVNASKKSDVNKKGNIRGGRVTANKLADGNVVASKLAGIDVVQVSNPGGIATASCPPGERLLGGGAEASSGVLTHSNPDGNNWEAVAEGTGTNNVTVYALCLRGTAG
jgi:hypothetical protein